ncbi:NgoMIV family type II restriction endonuclease [Nonomuraea sp. NPDC049655]|uniref:NgoMIV family type II restriction endonuclease n=1 Tax=Nonomuraea sp. NPDC049655 TaxID=3364355 RepID=UPI0037B4CABD
MTAPFAKHLLGWLLNNKKQILVPNSADTDSDQSVALAGEVLNQLGVPAGVPTAVPGNPGPVLESLVEADITARLAQHRSGRPWIVTRGRIVADFAQYQHLRAVDSLVKRDPAIAVTIGRDYLIKPDVTVGIADPDGGSPFLHAAISCKWTIRSDRVQNIRHEFNQMIRHRRGRQPHLVTVTAEPLPSRLQAIARGTGEVDAVYHIAYDALAAAVQNVGNQTQQAAWDECIQQGRVLNYAALVPTLITW